VSAPTILVVEDEPLSQDMLTKRLQGRGYQVDACRNAQECLEWLKAGHRASVILMDIAMPGMTGIECVKEIRKTFSHDALPIIMVSARVDSDDVVESLTAGANDYVVKPVNFRVLIARIKSALRMRKGVSLLVEAERQRVMMESLSATASRIAKPLSVIVDQLEELMADLPNKPVAQIQDALHGMLDITSDLVDVVGQLKTISKMKNVSYTQRLEMLDDSSDNEFRVES
jgi:DNA-binding response OmpR family regulator